MEDEEQLDIYAYMASRGIEDKIIERMKNEKIDKEVILLMKDDALGQFVPLAGDRIAIRSFCEGKRRSQSKKNTILNKLRSKLKKKRGQEISSSDDDDSDSRSMHLKGNKNARRSERRIDMGWLDKCETTGKYKQVRKHNGGGTQQLSVAKSTGPAKLLDIATELFFRDGVSLKGKLGYFECEICDFRHHKLEEGTTVGKLYDAMKMPVLRFYLKTSKIIKDESTNRSNRSEQQKTDFAGVDDALESSDDFDIDLPFVDVGFEMLQSTSSAHIESDVYQLQTLVQPDTPTISFGPTGPVASEVRNENNEHHNNTIANEETVLLIRRSFILEDMIKAFSNENIMTSHVAVHMILPNGDFEAGTGSGVFKDALTQFWQDFFQKLTIGDTFKVPVIRHDYTEIEWRAIGRIIAKGWVDKHFFPISLAPPFIATAIFGSSIQVDTRASFLAFIPELERQVIQAALESFPEDTDELTDILGGYDCRKIITEENIARIVGKLGHKEIVQKPMFIADAMRPMLAPLRDNFSESGFFQMYKDMRPTAKKVVSLLQFPDRMSVNENAVATYLRRFVRSLDEKMLGNFLRFCTGCDIICGDNISVDFSELDGFERRPIAHTCGNVLEVPKSYIIPCIIEYHVLTSQYHVTPCNHPGNTMRSTVVASDIACHRFH